MTEWQGKGDFRLGGWKKLCKEEIFGMTMERQEKNSQGKNVSGKQDELMEVVRANHVGHSKKKKKKSGLN